MTNLKSKIFMFLQFLLMVTNFDLVSAGRGPASQTADLPGFGAVISLLTIAAIAYVTPHLGKDESGENTK